MPNGRLLHHIIECWDTRASQDVCKNTVVKYPATEIKLKLKSSMIRFSVWAATSAGKSLESVSFVANGEKPYPLPIVILGFDKPPSLVRYDIDNGYSNTIPTPIAPSFIAHDDWTKSIFLASEDGNLFQLNLHTERSTFIRKLNSRISNMLVDRAGRYLMYTADTDLKMIDLQNLQADVIDVFKNKEIIKDVSQNADGVFFFTDINDKMHSLQFSKNGQNRNVSSFEMSSCKNQNYIDVIAIQSSKAGKFMLRDGESGNIYTASDDKTDCKFITKTEYNDKVIMKADASRGYVYSHLKGQLNVYDFLTNNLSTVDIQKISENRFVSIEPMCKDCDKPSSDCLNVYFDSNELTVHPISETEAEAIFPKPEIKKSCSLSGFLPSTNYSISYGHENNESLWRSKFFYNTGNTKQPTITLADLTPNTKYKACFKMMNIYQETNKQESCLNFKTEEGASGPPEDVKAVVMSPNEVSLSWKPPKIIFSNSLNYELFWKSVNKINGAYARGSKTVTKKKKLEEQISSLVNNQTYQLWLVAVTPAGKVSKRSEIIEIHTFINPNGVIVHHIEPRRLTINWTNTEQAVEKFQVLYQSSSDNSTFKYVTENPVQAEFMKTYKMHIAKLLPSNCYQIKVAITYKTNPGVQFIWPKENSTCIWTEKDKPLVPGVPGIDTSKYHDLVVAWKTEEENVLLYELQKSSPDDSAWKTIYNDSNNFFSVANMANGNYTFRVRAFNTNGVSSFTAPSLEYDLESVRTYQLSSSSHLTTAAISFGIIGFLILVCSIYFLIIRSKFSIKKKKSKCHSSHPPDLELAQLRDLPIRGGFINNDNPMYQVDITDEDLAMIPKIKRSQITLTKFLGSGAFGEVYEGHVKELDSEDGLETRIAVKTLRKGATEAEKLEFLKEAKLMWNFKHAHILNLNAICLDNDPNFLILELMEAGDLLSYLRQGIKLSN